MAKVGKLPFNVQGKRQEYLLYYSRTGGFSLKEFPHDILEIADMSCNFFATEHDLVVFHKEAIQKYEIYMKKKRKVILYLIRIPTCKYMNKTDYGHFQGYQSWISEDVARKINSLSGNGFGFEIEWRVCLRVDFKGIQYYDVKDFEGDDDSARRRTNKTSEEYEIDFTPERANFFTSLELQADAMVKKIVTFFSQDEPKLLSEFDKGGNMKFLTAGTQK